MAGGKGGKELAHLIPVRRDPVQMNGAFPLTDDGREWPITGSRSNGTKNGKVLPEVRCPPSSSYKCRERMKW